FRVLGIPVTRGRGFDANDVAGRPRVMIVSADLARRMWPGEDPLGKRVNCCEEETPGDPRLKTVVGVAEDVRTAGPSIAVDPEFYLPIEQVPPAAWSWIQRSMTIVVRGPAAPQALTRAMRTAVAEVDPS